MNNKWMIENCAYTHKKDDNKVKIENLKIKCSKLENEVKTMKEEQEKINPQIDLMRRRIMKLKREVERLTSLCNGMTSTNKVMRNENEMFDKSKSPDVVEEKEKIKGKKQSKFKKSEEQSRKIISTDTHKCNKYDGV